MRYISDEYMLFIENRLNNCPMKILNMQTPWEVANRHFQRVALNVTNRALTYFNLQIIGIRLLTGRPFSTVSIVHL